MYFKKWLITEEASGILLAKAINKEGYESISREGFKLQQSHTDAQNVFDKYNDRSSEQNYGPGLYFSFVSSAEKAKGDCAKYKDFGDYVVLATIPNPCRLLVTYWFPENHPIWKLTPLGESAGVYDQLVALNINSKFPDFKKGDTAIQNEWGYKLSKLVDGWVHQHNMLPHIVVYNPSILQFAGGFACNNSPSGQTDKSNNSTNQSDQPPNTNPITGRPFDKNIPLSKQTRLKSFDPLLKKVREIQNNPNHPEYSYWKDYQVFEPKNPASNLGLEKI